MCDRVRDPTEASSLLDSTLFSLSAIIAGSTIVAVEATWAVKVLLTSAAVLLVGPVVGLRVQI